MTYEFSKYNGCGNDFILIDNRRSHFPLDAHWIKNICTRRTGVGADGLILLNKSEKGDFAMQIFNADGSEAEMCGNGARCFLKFLNDLGLPNTSYRIETKERILKGWYEGEEYTVDMGLPADVAWNQSIEGMTFQCLNTGVPHAVLFVEDLNNLNIEELGRKIRFHPHFAPNGTNVTFARVLSPKTLLFTTYERGVEGQTQACGTGAAAAAYAYAILEEIEPPIDVLTKRGGKIKISFDASHRLTMTGPAKFVFNGRLPIETKAAIE